MSAYLIPGLLGLLTGLLLHWGRFSRADGLRAALGLRRSLTLRSGQTALGWGVLLTALLMWLAVIDVDAVTVLPLSLGALLGGLIFGISAGLCGFTPTTAFAGLGGGNALEALCALAGCTLMTWLPVGEALRPLREPWLAATLFRVTLDEAFLFDGAFLGMGCLGATFIVWGMCVPSPKRGGEMRNSACGNAESSGEESPDPASAAEEAVVIALEGEEPLVIDTELDEASDTSAEEAVIIEPEPEEKASTLPDDPSDESNSEF